MYLHFYSLTTWYQKKIDIADASPQCIIPNFRHLMNEWMNEYMTWTDETVNEITIYTYIHILLDWIHAVPWPHFGHIWLVYVLYHHSMAGKVLFRFLDSVFSFFFFPNCKETFVTTESSCRYTIKEDHKSADFFFIFS